MKEVRQNEIYPAGYVAIGLIILLCFGIYFTPKPNKNNPALTLNSNPSLEQVRQNLKDEYTVLYISVRERNRARLEEKRPEIVPPEILFSSEEFFPTSGVSDALAKSISELCKLNAFLNMAPGDIPEEAELNAFHEEQRMLNPLILALNAKNSP